MILRHLERLEKSYEGLKNNSLFLKLLNHMKKEIWTRFFWKSKDSLEIWEQVGRSNGFVIVT